MSLPNRHLLIIGSAKSGTSSLYRWLADHPDVCGSNVKETYFFAPNFHKDAAHGPDEPIDVFAQYFDHATSDDQLRIEATPFTMYDATSAERISDGFEDVRVLALVRDPVTRFVSDYRFLKQRESLPTPDASAREFFESMASLEDPKTNTLGIGRYETFLQPFAERLGRNRVEVMFFEELRDDQVGEMEALASRHGLEAGFYADYGFEVMNRTIAVSNPRINALRMRLEKPVRAARNAVRSNEKLHAAFERAVDAGRHRMEEWSSSPDAEPEPIPEDVLTSLAEWYAPHNRALAEFCGRPLPTSWKLAGEAAEVT